MSQFDPSPKNIQQPVRQVAKQPWFETLARLGYAAKGIVYFVVGLLAAQAALGTGGKTTDTSGALEEIIVQPFGKLLLSIVALGLVGYALWRVVQTVLDPEHKGQKLTAKRSAQRLGYAFSAISYTGLALTAVRLVLGSGRSQANASQDWTARFLSQPFGQVLVGIAGAIVLGVGIAFFYQAYKATFRRHFKISEMTAGEQTWITRLGRFGVTARGIVFTIIGSFLMVAAVQLNARQAKGLGGALATLAEQPFGPWLLSFVALGLIAYSLYSLAEARYRKIIQ